MQDNCDNERRRRKEKIERGEEEEKKQINRDIGKEGCKMKG